MEIAEMAVRSCRVMLLLIVVVFLAGGLVKPATSQDTLPTTTTTLATTTANLDNSSTTTADSNLTTTTNDTTTTGPTTTNDTTTSPTTTNDTATTDPTNTTATTTTESSTSTSQATNTTTGETTTATTTPGPTTTPTSTATTTSSTAPTTLPAETTTVADHCASSPCIRGSCTNTQTYNYTCECGNIWTGKNCENLQNLWLTNMDTSVNDTDITLSTFLSIPFPYFERVASRLITYSDGYVSFDSNFRSSRAPIGTGWPEYPSIFGVYWAPITILAQATSQLRWLREDARLNGLNYSSNLIDYVKLVVNESSFEPLLIDVRTWQDVFPSKSTNYSTNDKATFQLILATDSKFSYAIKNYKTVWIDALTNINGRSLVSADYSGENGTRIYGSVPDSTTGPLLVKLFSSGTPTRGPYECVQGTLDVRAHIGRPFKACPCYLPQVLRDGWFEAMNQPSNCYQSILFPTGAQEKCCYNRFGRLIDYQTEESLPIQVNTSGTTIQSAFEKCNKEAPNLRTWFLNKFLLPNCSSYRIPTIAGIIGSLQVVMFDNNKYTFNALGDFVLIRNDNFEVQTRTRRMDNTNITSLEAIAIRVEKNNSSFQLYSQTSDPVWKFFNGPGDTPSMGTFKIVQTESNITLLLPSFIITVANNSDVITFTIQSNILDAKSNGLLGSVDGNSSNGFVFKNGTTLKPPVENLSGGSVRDFVQSWKIINETESLFNYPGARSFADVNNNTDFMPAPLATNVADTLNMFQDATKKMNAQQLCGDELFCLQDYYINDNNVSASEVLQQAKNFILQKEQSVVSPPKFNMPETIEVISNLSPTFTTMLMVENNMAVEFNIEKDEFQNISGISLNHSTFVWDLTNSLASLRSLTYPRDMRFYATSLAELSAEYVPVIYLCLCEQASQCLRSGLKYDLNNDRPEGGNVNNILCSCGDKFGGKFCEKTVSFCDNCYNNLTCNASNTDYCAACPSGYTGDGKNCDDIDECSPNKGGCDHMCTNKNGSFECSCRPGYTQNGTKCLDINECQQDANICKSQFKYCHNIPGTYSCPCLSYLVGQDTCFKAAKTFIGTIELADSGNQKWNTRLTDTMSPEFQTLAESVTKSITTAMNNTGTFNASTLFVEVLAFEEVRPATRKRRDTAPSNSHTVVKFAIYVADDTVTTDIVNKLLGDFSNTTCNQSCQYGEIILYAKSPQLDSNASLCNYPQIHKCDELTSTCVQSQQTTSCVCKPGYEYSPEYLVCRDKNECAGNVSQLCPDGGACTNTAGSYKCDCSAGRFWDSNTTKCVVDGCSTQPCQNSGVCFTLLNPEQYVCRCTYGWEGTLCENEDAEANRMEVAVICVSVILGICCLVLFIILIIICIRHHRSGSDWTLESDSYTNSRYNDGDHLPRAKISNRAGTEMAENGQNSAYQRLNYGQPGQNQTTFGRHSPTPNSKIDDRKSVYENRAYEGDGGERL